jgi:CRISPR-associated protein Csb2
VIGSVTVAGHETELIATDGYDGTEISVTRPGYTDALRAAFERGRPAHEVPRRWVTYVPPDAAPAVGSPFDSPIVIALDRPRDPRSLRRITGALRASLESALNPGPVELHGHVAEGDVAPRHQIALVGLTTSEGKYSDGLVRGLALVFPHGLDPDVRRSVVRAAGELSELRMGREGVVRFDPKPKRLATLQARLWTRASSVWTTVTPMVSDRYLKATDEERWAQQVLQACRHLDLPVPVELDVSDVPWAPGSLLASTYDVRRPLPKDPARRAQRQGERPRPARHVRLRFAEPLLGPVLLGNMRYLGLGLCIPVTETT